MSEEYIRGLRAGEAQGEARRHELEATNQRLCEERRNNSNYTTALQHLVEALCHGRPLPADAAERAPHHHAMAVEYRQRQAEVVGLVVKALEGLTKGALG
jgi:hypothetical protein